jgi:hypothetical protein
MKRGMKSNKESVVAILTMVLWLGLGLALAMFANRIDAADPTEPFFVESTPITRAWEARQKRAALRSVEMVPRR